jgi:hypothetical protein
VLAEQAVITYVRYRKVVEEAHAAFDDLALICGLTVQSGTRWATRTALPGLPHSLGEVVARGTIRRVSLRPSAFVVRYTRR